MTKGHVVKKIAEQALLQLWGAAGNNDICETTARDCLAALKGLLALTAALDLTKEVDDAIKANLMYQPERYNKVLEEASHANSAFPGRQ